MRDFETNVIQRLVRVETLLTNHLHSHEKILWRILIPIFVGIIILIVKGIF